MATTPNADAYLPLLRTQMNDAFGWVEGTGFDPRSFEAGPAAWGQIQCTRFAHKGSSFFFDVNTARRTYSVRYSPGAGELLTTRHAYSQNFPSIQIPFVEWLSHLRRELDAPDLWAMAHDGPALFAAGGATTKNDPFTVGELAQIVAAVDRARAFLVDAGVAAELLRDANGKLDYLVAASRRSGRFDWANIAFSIMWSIAVAAAFDPGQAHALFETVAAAVRGLVAG